MEIESVVDLRVLLPIRTVTTTSLPDLPHDLRPRQCRGAHRQFDWHDAAVVPLGRLPHLHGAHAARFPSGLLGFQKQYGGEHTCIRKRAIQM